MSDTTSLLEALIEAGTPAKLVAQVAALAAKVEALDKRRAADAKRQRDSRSSRDVTRHHASSVTACDTPSPPASPSFSPSEPPPITTPSSPSSPAAADAADAVASSDPRKRLFGPGLQKTKLLTGRGEDSCRALIGKWLKVADDSAIEVLGAIDDAERNQVANPAGWITAVLNSRQRAPPPLLLAEDEDLPAWMQKATPDEKRKYRDLQARKANGKPPSEAPN